MVLSVWPICAFPFSSIDESSFSRWKSGSYTSDDSSKMQQLLFEHLCPLLVTRMLPLSIFNDLNSLVMYDQLSNQGIINGKLCASFKIFLSCTYNMQGTDMQQSLVEYLCPLLITRMLSILQPQFINHEWITFQSSWQALCPSIRYFCYSLVHAYITNSVQNWFSTIWHMLVKRVPCPMWSMLWGFLFGHIFLV